MMKLTIFGGTGKTGQILVQKALAAGHTVTVLARNPDKVTSQPGLQIIPGSITDPVCVTQAVRGADAVISVLGPVKGQEPLAISNGMKTIVESMQSAGVRRLVISAGAGVGDPQDRPGPVHRLFNLLLKTAARSAYDDMLGVVERVRSSPLDWTIVRAPMLTDDPGTGQVRTGYLGGAVGMRLPRADLADFLLEQAGIGKWLRQAPVISS